MILSALLSAVTGAFAGARPAEARLYQQSAQQSVAMAAPRAVAALPAAPRPVQPAPRLAGALAAPAAPVPQLLSPPIRTDRLRE